MHPNTFLNAFWQSNLLPQVFVAMSFHEKYNQRFEDVIKPSIESLTFNNQSLKAHRVDLSQTGDSIHTDIIEGIAHSRFVLADVSVTYRDDEGNPFRNGNVMYEVGLALACRQPSEVLLIRDDDDEFLFDLSPIPHKRINFQDAVKARQELSQILEDRLKEIANISGKRTEMIYRQLTHDEWMTLQVAKKDNNKRFIEVFAGSPVHTYSTIDRLLGKGLMRLSNFPVNKDQPVFKYLLTELGLDVAQLINDFISEEQNSGTQGD